MDQAVSLTTRALARLTPWVESEVLGLSALVRPGDVCLDIGAGAGIYTAELARLVGPGGQVHSIEPLVFAHRAVSELLALRRGPAVRAHALALAEVTGRSHLSVPLRGPRFVTGRAFLTGGTAALGANREFDAQVEVRTPTERLDDFAARLGLPRVHFVKADTEGSEWSVLRGGADLLGRDRPALLLEVEPRHLARYGLAPPEFLAWLGEFGYRPRVWRGAWQPVPGLVDGHRNYLFTAGEAVRPGGRR